ncbi:MAG: VCBS repeat-containing protein [Planctomycetes bacterium]|nr:VCBS repeat-containing protein [Planctomycetota bacterium]
MNVRSCCAVLALASSLLAQELRVAADSLARLPADDSPLWLADLDGDGDQDLVSISAESLAVWRLGADRTYPETPDAKLVWDDADVAFDLGDLDRDGATEVLVVSGGRTLRRYVLGADGFGEPTTLRDDLGAALPRGVHRVPFVQDVDGSPPEDLVIPGPGLFHIFRSQPDGLSAPIDVAFESRVETSVGNPDSLDSRFRQDVTIPWFHMRDVDGDGRLDLLSETSDRVLFHIADPELPTRPTWRLDLQRFRDEVELEQIDFFDLTRNMSALVTWRLADLDGVPPNDLVIQQGSTLLIWMGGSRGGIDRNPDDVLPSSGNLLLYAFFDTVGDPLPELHILRLEDITLGELVRMAVMDSETTLEVYSYRNRGGHFDRKAMSVVQVNLELPSLIDIDDHDSAVRVGVRARLKSDNGAKPHHACLDPDGLLDDAVVYEDGRLRFWRDALPRDGLGTDRGDMRDALLTAVDESGLTGLSSFLRRRDDAPEGQVLRKSYDVSVDDLVEGASGIQRMLRALDRDVPPALEAPTVFGEHEPDVIVTDLDGDGISDVLLVHTLQRSDDEPSLRTVEAVILGRTPRPSEAPATDGDG